VSDNSLASVDPDAKPLILGHGDPWCTQCHIVTRPNNGKVNGVAFVELGNIRPMHPLEAFFGFMDTMGGKSAGLEKNAELRIA